MAPALVQFEQEYKEKITVVRVNLSQKDSASYKKYIKLLDSQSPPYTILLDTSGKIIKQNGGEMSVQELRDSFAPSK